jgi:hypothetical protein
MAAALATLEKQRNALGFHQIGKANGIPIYVSTQGASASESEKRVVVPKLGLATHQLLLTGLSLDSLLRGKFNNNGKGDTCFWISGTGRNTNHLITDSQDPEITDSQEAEIFKLAESGMKYTDVAQKLGIPAVGVYYALKKGPKGRKKASKRPRTSILCSFNKEGDLIIGNRDSIETSVRVSKGSDEDPLLFFVLLTVTLGSVARVSSSLRATGGSSGLILSLG